MRDLQELMKKFVKIIETYPEVYDNSLDGYRSQQAELAWDKIAELVKVDLKEECTVEELKAKWKGVRSSYNRYKNKLSIGTVICKKYYLYDYLHFLDPFIKPRGLISQEHTNKKRDHSNFGDNNDNDTLSERDPLDDWEVDVKHIDIMEVSRAKNDGKNLIGTMNIIDCTAGTGHESESVNTFNTSDCWNSDVKPNFNQDEKHEHKPNIIETSIARSSSKRNTNNKNNKCAEENTTDINEDLQFFKSILSDIKSFTTKEKRKLKMGILQLIDDVENERKRQRLNE